MVARLTEDLAVERIAVLYQDTIVASRIVQCVKLGSVALQVRSLDDERKVMDRHYASSVPHSRVGSGQSPVEAAARGFATAFGVRTRARGCS